MESRPIPIEELKSGEFYDIEINELSIRVFGALLLEHLPSGRAELMIMNSSDRKYTTSNRTYIPEISLTIVTMQLGCVYPYLTYTQLPDQILRWHNSYNGSKLITQIKEEMSRVVSECCWTFNLPHFCEGYLQVYLSYVTCGYNVPNREELLDLWFYFMRSYFSALRDHFLQVQVLSEKNICGLLEARKGMEHISEISWDIREPRIAAKATELVDIKKSCFDSYRTIELYPGIIDRLWELTSRQYRQDLSTDQIQDHLRALFRDLYKFIAKLSYYPDFARYLMKLNIQELHSEEILRLRFRITVAAHLLDVADYLFEQSGIEPPQRILEAESELTRCSEKLQDLVMTRVELVPSLLAYLKSILRGSVHLRNLLKCVTTRITVRDWQFINFLINHKSLECQIISIKETSDQIKELVGVALEHKMTSESLRSLLPCATYGHIVFTALAERFSLPHSREVMTTYFSLNKFIMDIESLQAKDIFSFFRYLPTRIELEDWQFITFAIQDFILSPANWYSLLYSQEMDNHVKQLVTTALEHKMSAELLRDLLPWVDYGHLVFPALVERIESPQYKQAMITYFRPELRNIDIHNTQFQDRYFFFFRFLISRIALEDWEFVGLVIQHYTLSPPKWHSFDDQKMHESIQELVSVALEHKMSAELLLNLFPCANYGHLIFPALAEEFSLPYCREVMITYFSSDQWYVDFSNPQASYRLLSFFKGLTGRIALEDWEFLTFVIQNQLTPASLDSYRVVQKMYESVKELVSVALEHKMSAELLSSVLPCVSYDSLVFPAIAKGFLRSRCSKMMLGYFESEQRCSEIAREMVLTYYPSEGQSLHIAGQQSRIRGQKNIGVRNT